MTLDELKKSAKKTVDEHGQPAVLIPLSVWEKFMSKVKPELSQREKILALFDEWDKHPEDDGTEQWWEEFDAFMRENRFTVEERDLGFDAE
jgi:hypothetical protein